MPRTLQIRNVPDDVHRELRARAALAGKSLSDYLLEEVSKVAARPPVSEVLRRASQRHGGASMDDIVKAIRDGRDLR